MAVHGLLKTGRERPSSAFNRREEEIAESIAESPFNIFLTDIKVDWFKNKSEIIQWECRNHISLKL